MARDAACDRSKKVALVDLHTKVIERWFLLSLKAKYAGESIILYLKVIYDKKCNHNYNKILKSDWLSTVLISALITQFNRTVHTIMRT